MLLVLIEIRYIMIPWIVTCSLAAIVLAAIYQYISRRQRYFEELKIPHLKPRFLIGNVGALIVRKTSFAEEMVLQAISRRQVSWLLRVYDTRNYDQRFGTD